MNIPYTQIIRFKFIELLFMNDSMNEQISVHKVLLCTHIYKLMTMNFVL